MGLIDKMRNMSYEELRGMDVENLSDGMLKVRSAFLQARVFERNIKNASSPEEAEAGRKQVEKKLAIAEMFAEYYAHEENPEEEGGEL